MSVSLFQEFKKFAVRGNVIDLAVGVVIGAAFGRIVTSVVNDIIMPPIGKVAGGVNFADLFINLDPTKLTKAGQPVVSLAQAKEAGAAVIAYGSFFNTVLEFVIVAAAVFMLVRVINRIHRPAPVPVVPAGPTPQEKLLAEIRDLLKARAD